MKTKGAMWLSLAMILLLGWAVHAQEAGSPPETAPASSADSAAATSMTLNWEEGVFALLVVAVVMLGLIGFEWIHRRNQTMP